MLDQAYQGDKGDIIYKTLKIIQETGFSVIRIWAFQEHDNNDHDDKHPRDPDQPLLAMQKAPGADGTVNIVDKPPFKNLDYVMEKVRLVNEEAKTNKDGNRQSVKVMLCLTNCVPSYGGLWKYVSWANEEGDTKDVKPTFDDKERYKFYSSQKARKYYKNYVKEVVKHCISMPYGKDAGDIIHSWDICNEPRNYTVNAPTDAPIAGSIAYWVNEAVQAIREEDIKHPITVGTEGWYKEENSGADWVAEARTHIDFCCIHPYWDNWAPQATPVTRNANPKSWGKDIDGKDITTLPDYWLDRNKRWIKSHIDEAKSAGKPLVLQEFNMPDHFPDNTKEVKDETPIDSNQVRSLRKKYYDHVTQLLKDGELAGAMVWMVAAKGYYNDRYTIYGDVDKQGSVTLGEDLKDLKQMIIDRNLNKPSSS